MTGSVSVCGLDPGRCEMYELAERVGSVFQNPKSQFFNLTSNDELAFGLESRGVPVAEIEARIRTTVEALDARRLLGRNVTEMSGGERQSLVFASVDVARPDVYVLDEPPRTSTRPPCRGCMTRCAPSSRRAGTVINRRAPALFRLGPHRPRRSRRGRPHSPRVLAGRAPGALLGGAGGDGAPRRRRGRCPRRARAARGDGQPDGGWPRAGRLHRGSGGRGGVRPAKA